MATGVYQNASEVLRDGLQRHRVACSGFRTGVAAVDWGASPKLPRPAPAFLAILFGCPSWTTGTAVMDTRSTPGNPLGMPVPGTTLFTSSGGLGHAETDVVVTIRGVVPVAVGGAKFLRFVVPGTAAQHTAVTNGRCPLKIRFL